MIQPGKIQEFTQLNFMQPSSQGYTSEVGRRDNKIEQNKTETTGNLTVVAITPTPGNREIDHELVLRAQRGDKRGLGEGGGETHLEAAGGEAHGLDQRRQGLRGLDADDAVVAGPGKVRFADVQGAVRGEGHPVVAVA